jgi:Scramblase.
MLLERETYVVKEQVALVKLTATYDLLDAETGQTIGIAKEEPSSWAKWLRIVADKHMLPTAINVYEGASTTPVLSIYRGFTFLRAKVAVTAAGRTIGHLEAKLMSVGPSFRILDAQDAEIGSVKGDWKGWNFKILGGSGEELGTITKKWAGLGKELFTSADTYVIALSAGAAGRPDVGALLLAAGLAVDTIYKEKK